MACPERRGLCTSTRLPALQFLGASADGTPSRNQGTVSGVSWNRTQSRPHASRWELGTGPGGCISTAETSKLQSRAPRPEPAVKPSSARPWQCSSVRRTAPTAGVLRGHSSRGLQRLTCPGLSLQAGGSRGSLGGLQVSGEMSSPCPHYVNSLFITPSSTSIPSAICFLL